MSERDQGGSVAPLTDDDHNAVTAVADAWAAICKVVGNGPTRQDDLIEVVAHIHALQHFVMAQAAARCYPDLYRLAGETLPEPTQASLPAWGGHSPRVGERQPDRFFAYCQGGCFWSSDSPNARRLALYHSRTHGHRVAVEVIATLVYDAPAKATAQGEPHV